MRSSVWQTFSICSVCSVFKWVKYASRVYDKLEPLQYSRNLYTLSKSALTNNTQQQQQQKHFTEKPKPRVVTFRNIYTSLQRERHKHYKSHCAFFVITAYCRRVKYNSILYNVFSMAPIYVKHMFRNNSQLKHPTCCDQCHCCISDNTASRRQSSD